VLIVYKQLPCLLPQTICANKALLLESALYISLQLILIIYFLRLVEIRAKLNKDGMANIVLKKTASPNILVNHML